jgi:small subunit ribosomal protein S1
VGDVTEPAEDLEALLDRAENLGEPRRGDLLNGIVISVEPQGLIVDLALKRDGVVPRDDLERLPPEEGNIKVGDEVAVMVVNPVDSEGNLVVSLSLARESDDWLEAQRMLEADQLIEGVPTDCNRGGLIVPFGSLRGFVPASHLASLPRGLGEEERMGRLKALVGGTIPLKVIEVDPQRRRLVLSERKAIRQWRHEQKARLIKTLKEGEVRKGVVTSLREFGAFVDIGGADGLIHISEMSWQRVDDPSQVLSVGQEVEIMITRLNHESNRIGLSLKRLLPNPWDGAAGRVEPGEEVEATVSHLASNRVYVALEGGLEGLITQPDGLAGLAVGETVEVRVLAFDPEERRLEFELLGPAGAEAPAEDEPDGEATS